MRQVIISLPVLAGLDAASRISGSRDLKSNDAGGPPEGFPNDDDLMFYIPFNIILVISRQWKGDNERLSAVKGKFHPKLRLSKTCFLKVGIKKTRLFKYIENFTAKKWKISD